MNWKDLENAVAKAQQKLQEVELQALDAERGAKAAKAKAQRLKLKHRRARKVAKKTKRVARCIAEKAKEQCRVLEKAERRLARALAKSGRLRLGARREAVPAAARRPASAKSVMAKTAPGRRTAVPVGTRRHSRNGHPSLPSPHPPEDVGAQ